MYGKKISLGSPFFLISKIRELEEKLVNVQMISRMHDSATLSKQVKIMIALLDISRKYHLLGHTAKAARAYTRVLSIYKTLI